MYLRSTGKNDTLYHDTLATPFNGESKKITIVVVVVVVYLMSTLSPLQVEEIF